MLHRSWERPRGARYLDLSLDLPESTRGRWLTADELERFRARLESFIVERGA